MSYDDVASSRDNPFPGKLFNKPTEKGTPGRDVYEGCNIAYRRHDVTPKKLLQVLTGDAENAKGPVLKSDENSEIFFYFADHGAPGLVAMPCSNIAPDCLWGGYLYADKLLGAFKTMKEKKMYKQMTVYMEACESGSMFKNLDKSLGIYAVSAANGSESSWASYCYPNDMVNGTHITSCLGDLFSVNWLEDSDRANMVMEKLQTQYDLVKKETTKSHVLQWGDLSYTNETIATFEADLSHQPKVSFWDSLINAATDIAVDVMTHDEEVRTKNEYAVDSRDVKLHYFYNKVISDPSKENNLALKKEITNRMTIDDRFQKIFPNHVDAFKSNTTPEPTDFDCYRKLVDTYEESCGRMDDFSLKYMKYFVAECEGLKSIPDGSDQSVKKIKEQCLSKE